MKSVLRSVCWSALLLLVLLQLAAAPCAAAETLKLGDGDVVVLLGGTFAERDQAHGYLETSLTSRFHAANLIFRNLGWSGDTVFGEARAGFGSATDGFRHLQEHVASLKPTVVLVAYGYSESFAGKAGLPQFTAGLTTLLAGLGQTKARIVLLQPLNHEDLGRPLPDPREHNANLKLYREAIAQVAAERSLLVADFHDVISATPATKDRQPLTDNGLHLTAYGYWTTAPAIEKSLGLAAQPWLVELDASGKLSQATGVKVSEMAASGGLVKFKTLDDCLPRVAPPAKSPASAAQSLARTLRVTGLPSGKYALAIDGQKVATGTAEEWTAGVVLTAGPEYAQAEKLRQQIVAKNQLYFYRWRPQNETYLFGFRKHEQGNNAKEIPEFDPLVAANEAVIHTLAAPAPHQYQLQKVEQ